MEANVVTVFIAAMITAIFTGFGALPFLFLKEVSNRTLSLANAVAAGLMTGASIGLVVEGAAYGVPRTIVGLLLGVVLIVVARRVLEGREEVGVDQLVDADALTALLILGVMTVHSFAEGVGVGVSWGDGESLGSLITLAIAIHNIPEGLAISLVLIPRGASVLKAAGWSVFTSLPQPIMAIPAFLFVLVFQPFLPVGLGLAAGAMFYMVGSELLPEALAHASKWAVYPTMAAAVVGMLAFQVVIG